MIFCVALCIFYCKTEPVIQQPPRICWTSKGSLFTLDVSLFRMYRTVYRAIRELIQWRQGESNIFHEKITRKATTPHVHRTLGVFLTSMATLYWMSHNFPFYEERQDCIFIFLILATVSKNSVPCGIIIHLPLLSSYYESFCYSY